MDADKLKYIPEFREAWERSQKATPGPWRRGKAFFHSQLYPRNKIVPIDFDGPVHGDGGVGGSWLVAWLFSGAMPKGCQTPNADFIAHARTDLPAALTALAEMRAVLTEHEWANKCVYCGDKECPACHACKKYPSETHSPDCWLARLLHPVADLAKETP